MPADEIERIARRHIPGEGALEIEHVSGGLENETYRVVRQDCAYALRIALADTLDRGRDASWECGVIKRAAAAGIAPDLVVCDPDNGLLVSRWVEGRSWTAADVRLPGSLERMADLLRRVHALTLAAPGREMSPRRWIERYSAAARSISGSDRDDPEAALLRAAAASRLAELERLAPRAPVLCHSDLHALNLIDRGNSLVLLDWEYAHGADPFWDLAGWSVNNEFGADLRHDLLMAYAGRPPSPGEEHRLGLLCWLYDYVCLLWCELAASQGAGGRGKAAGRACELRARLGTA